MNESIQVSSDNLIRRANQWHTNTHTDTYIELSTLAINIGNSSLRHRRNSLSSQVSIVSKGLSLFIGISSMRFQILENTVSFNMATCFHANSSTATTLHHCHCSARSARWNGSFSTLSEMLVQLECTGERLSKVTERHDAAAGIKMKDRERFNSLCLHFEPI